MSKKMFQLITGITTGIATIASAIVVFIVELRQEKSTIFSG